MCCTQCASVSRVARMGHRKFKVADEKSSNKLFDEAYRLGALNTLDHTQIVIPATPARKSML